MSRVAHLPLFILYLVVVAFTYYGLFIQYAAFTEDSPNPGVLSRMVFLLTLLAPLFLVPRLRTLARIVLVGQVFTFDRLADSLQRNERIVCPMSSIDSVQILFRGGKTNKYYVSVACMDGTRNEIAFWISEKESYNLAKEIANYAGVRVVED